MAESPIVYGLERSRNLLLSTDSFDRKMHVSREFLAARSEYFARIFEANIGKEHIHLDVDGFALLSLLDVLYTGGLVHHKHEYMITRTSDGECHNSGGLYFGSEIRALDSLFGLAEEVDCSEMVKAAVLRLFLPVPCQDNKCEHHTYRMILGLQHGIEELTAVYRPTRSSLAKVFANEEGSYPGMRGFMTTIVEKNIPFLAQLPE